MRPFQIELTRLTLGFAQAPPTLLKCKTYPKKNTSCLKGGYKLLSCVFCSSPTTPHRKTHTHTHTHTHKSLLLCNSGLTPNCISTYTLVPFSFMKWLNYFLNECVIFFFFFLVFFFPPSHLAPHNAKSSRNLFTLLPLTACPISLLLCGVMWCVPK
jgi:hypothetical protein